MKSYINFILILFFLLISNIDLTAQSSMVMGLPYDEIHAKNDVAMPYQYVREADVMWSKIVWRRIELKEKRNHILHLPTEPIGQKKSLIDVVLYAIQEQGVTAYDAKSIDAGIEFNTILKAEDINEKMGAKQEMMLVQVLEGYDTVLVDVPYRSSEVTSYLLKEVWFFDKQRSVLDVRIIGFCPVREYYRKADQNQTDPQYSKTFWIYYPEIRPFLAQSPVYNPNTDVSNLTYDDIFQKRYFSSYIIQESNPYNRSIEAYEMGLEALIEAEKIKNKIFNFEQDLWEY